MERVAPAIVAVVLLSALASGATPAATPGVEATNADARSPQVGGGWAFASGESFWRGQTLSFDAGDAVEDASSASSEERTFQIWEVDGEGEATRVVTSFTVDGSGEHRIDTSSFEGRYVVQYGGEPVYVADGVAHVSETPEGDPVTVERGAWTVDRQRVSASWIDPRVFEDQAATLELSSNRDRYVAAVSSEALSYEELTALFGPETYAEDHDARRSEDVLLVNASGSPRFRANGSVLPTGSHTFRVEAVDTGSSASAQVSVPEAGDGPTIESFQRRGTVGDHVTVTVACSNCHVLLGGPREGMLDLLELTDANGDGLVTLTINTRYAGLHPGSAIPSGVRAYTAGPDEVRRYDTSDQFEDRPIHRDSAYVGLVRRALGLDSSGRAAVRSPGGLTVHVSPSDYAISREKYGDNRPPASGPLVLPDETDAATIELGERSLDGLDTSIAPRVVGDPPAASRIVERSSPGERIAIGDQLVVGVDVSGVFGHLDARGESIDAIVDNDGEGIAFELVPAGPGGGDPVRLGSAARLDVDEGEERLSVVIDTGTLADEGELAAGTEYAVRFRLTGSGPAVTDESDDGSPEGYPYLPVGTDGTTESTVTVVEPDVEITEPAGSNVTRTDDLVVSGTTTLAPGSTVAVGANAEDPYVWSTSSSATVGADGTWRAVLGFEGSTGDRFALRASNLGTRMDGVDVRFVNETTRTATPTGGTGDGSDGDPTATPRGNGSDGDPTATPSVSESPGAPGTDTPSTPGEGSGIPGLSFVTGLGVEGIGGAVGLVAVLFVGLRLFNGLR